MAIELKSVFVSSTSDLLEEREAVRSVIRDYQIERQLLPYISDSDMRPGATPEERLREEIRNADLFMMILGGRFGSLHPKAATQPPPSICEWEFEEARQRGLTMLSLEKVLPPETIEEPQRRFRDRVREFCSGVWRKTFADRDEFTRILVGVLMAWALSEKRSTRRTEALTWGALALGALLVLSLPWLDNNVSRAFVAGVVAMITVVLLGFAGQNLIRMVRR
jgi:Domain of unknown function (DUF4062)